APHGTCQPHWRARGRHSWRGGIVAGRGAGEGPDQRRPGRGRHRGACRDTRMSFALKLDRIVDRAAELRALLSEGATGDAYVKASRELSEIEPVVARIDE